MGNFNVLDQDGNPIAGVLEVVNSNTQINFTASAQLPNSNNISATATSGIKGSNGLDIVPHTIHFTTKAAETPPQVTNTVPADGATDVPENQVISFAFNKPLDPTTVN